MDTLTGDAFRVLVLLPGERDAPLRCELLTTSLADHPPYEALSYVWSIKPDPAHLELDGQGVAITEGLEDILFRLRHASNSRTLWIDRLCINQSDTTEKSAQVSQMRAIYSNCTRALLWMGELEEGTQLADAEAGVAFLEYLAAFDPGSDSESEIDSDSDASSNSDTSSNSKASSGPETDSHSDVGSDEATVPTVPECVGSEESFRAAMAALGRISPRKGPWWKRVWTVQEAMLPPDAVFLWGPFSISWDTMAAASGAWIRTCDYEESMTGSQCEMLHNPGHLGDLMAHVIWMESYDSETGEPPLPTAIKWRGRSATMPVDKVYALTGLNAPGVLPRSEKCDYALDLRQVYINYTVDLIHADGDNGDLQPLVVDPRREDELDDGARLPRWAVDMRSFPKYDTVPWRQHHFYHRFEANKDLPRDYPPQYDGEALRLSGLAIDTVAEVGEGHYVEVEGTNEYPPIRPILRAWWTQYCKSPLANLDVAEDVLYCGLEPGNCAAYDRFCRLVLGEILGDDGEQTPLDGEATLQDRQDVARHLRTGEDEPVDRLRVSVGRAIKNRRFFVTVGGLLGLGHLETEPGDEVWVFSHGRVPFTLRPRRGGGAGGSSHAEKAGSVGEGGDPPDTNSAGGDDYDFVGACHVQGIMFGDDGIRAAAELGQRIARLY